MKLDEQNIAIAEFCGWKRDETARPGLDGTFPWSNGWQLVYDDWNLPQYASDLNMMYEAEEILTPEQYEIFALHLGPLTKIRQREYISASAEKRAEAFLKTLGKWK